MLRIFQVSFEESENSGEISYKIYENLGFTEKFLRKLLEILDNISYNWCNFQPIKVFYIKVL